MGIIEPIIRPPAEAGSFLLQVTVGCSANQCKFCGAYRTKDFGVQNLGEIVSDIRGYSSRYPCTRRVFLLDGDALSLNNNRLLPVLKVLNDSFPELTRISSYANGYNISKRSDAELKELYESRLRLIYLGLESGSQELLNYHNKVSTRNEMIEAVQRASRFQIKSSVMVLLGLGGRKFSRKHAVGTIEALNEMQPRYLSFLSLMVIPGTPLAKEVDAGEFEELNPMELLSEMYEIIKGLELKKTIFRSDHASNYLPLDGVFPKDKDRLLSVLKSAMGGGVGLRPEHFRGL